MTDIEKPDVIGATRRAETIRQGMISYAAAMEAIGEAFENRDWVALGHKDWDTYCEKEFSEKRLKLNRAQREQAVLAFRGAGMSTRAIAAALGVSDGTVRNDIAGAQNYAPAEVRGTDGKTYAPTKPVAQSEPADDARGEIPQPSNRTSGLGSTSPDAESGAVRPALPVPGEAGGVAAPPATGVTTPPVPPTGTASSPEEHGPVDPERPAVGVPPAAPANSGPSKREESEEEQRAREEREMREARSLEFATGLVNVRMRLEPDPVRWYQNVYVHGLYHARDLPRVRDTFTPTGMRQAARFLNELADHLEEIGEEL